MSLFLIVMTAVDAARLRTFFLVDYDATKTVFVAGFIITFASRFPLLLLENVPKRFILLDPNSRLALSDEAMAVPISRWLLLWLLPVLRRGYKTADLSLKDLGDMPQDSAAVYARFEKAWTKHQRKKLPIARALCSAFPGELMAPLLSVFLWCLLLMSVPLELAGLLRFLECVEPVVACSYSPWGLRSSWRTDEPQPVSYGWALVAAFGLTYLLTPIALATAQFAWVSTAALIRQALVEAVYRKGVRVLL